jgi:hypothetical protein
MFTLADEKETLWYPVQIEMAAKEGGRTQKFSFEAEFNRLEQDEITEIFRKREEDEPPVKDAEVLDRVLVGWRGVKNADGSDLEVNPGNRARLLNRFPASSSIVRAYLKSIGIEGKAKN